MLKCQSCGGTYEPTLPDGMDYYHACPPLSVVEIRAGLKAKTLTLPRVDAQRLQAAADADAATPVAADELPRVDQVLAQLRIERPGKRDENVVAGLGLKGVPKIKADGAGVIAVPAVP